MSTEERPTTQNDLPEFVEDFLGSFTEGVVLLDTEGTVLSVNDAWQELVYRHELSREVSVIGEDYLEVARNADLLTDSVADGIRSVFQGRKSDFQAVSSFGSDDDRQLETDVSRFEHEGAVYCTVRHRDVHSGPEKDLLRRKYEVVAEATDDVIVTIDTKSIIRDVNSSVQKVLGYEPEELLGESLTILIPEEYREAHLEGLRQYLESGQRHLNWDEVEFPGRHADGSDVPLSIAFNEVSVDGERFFVARLSDLSEQRAQQSELEKIRERFRQLTENLETVFWIVKEDYSEYEYLSPHFEELWGRPRDAFENLPEDFLETVHEDDRARIRRELDSQGEGDYEVEYRICRPDGEVRWVRDRAFPITDAAGKVNRIAGISEDVTERKRAQQQLADSEERFRRMAESMSEAFFLIGPDYQETYYVNPPAEEIYGVPLEDLQTDPQAWERNVHPEDLKEIHENIAAGTINVDDEFRVLIDGETRWLRARIYPVYGDDETLDKLAGIATDVTERKKAEQESSEKAEFLNAINDRMPGVAYQFQVDPDGTYSFRYLSEGYEEITGVPVEEATESFARAIRTVHPDDLEALYESIEEAVDNLDTWRHEVRFVHPGEGIRWAMGSARPEEREDGTVVFSGVIFDITERKNLEQRLEEETTRQELAQQIASLGHWSIGLPGWDVEWSEETYSIFGLDPEDQDLPLEEAFDYYHPEDRERCRKLVEEAAETESEVSFEARIETPTGEIRHIDVLGVPRWDPSGEIDELFGVVQDVTKYKETEQALRESERRFRQMAENIESVFWLSNPGGDVLYVSPAFEEIWGLPPEELYQDKHVFVERIHPEDRERILEAMYQDHHDGNYEDEFRIIRPDGETRWIHTRSFPVEDGNLDGPRVAGIAEDITERKHREQDLSLKNRMIEEAPIGISMIDPDWEDNPIVYVNDAFVDLTGYGDEKLVGNSHDILKGDETNSESINRMREAIANGESCTVELLNYRRDGSTFWNQVTLAPVRDEEGFITHFVRFNQDISERKETQQELRETEERFRQLTENIDEVFWISDPDTEEMIYVSPTYESVWGRSLQSLYEEPQSFLEAIHPEDRETVKTALPDQKNGEYDLKYRVQQPDGEIRWIRDRAFPVEDERGEVHRIVGIAEDITEMKELQREREKFVEVVEHSRSCIVRANLDREITYVNPAGLEMLGVEDLEHLKGEPLKTIHPEEDYEKYREAISTVEEGGQWHGERQYMNRSTGEPIDVLFDGFRIFDPETGEPIEYASVATDISEQIEIEEQLRSMVQEKETLLQEVHHRFKNNLQVVLGLLGLQARQLESEEARGALRNSERRIQSMAMIHEKLYEGAQLSSIDFDDYVGDLLEQIAETYHEDRKDLELITDIEPTNLDPDTIISCGLIINELVSNSLKHGFDEGNSFRVEVKFYTDKKLNYHLTVADNGRGIDAEELDESGSLGMRLVRNLARNQLHGDLRYAGDDGLEVEIVFPPAAARHEEKDP